MGSNETTPKKSQKIASGKLPDRGVEVESSPETYQFGGFTLDVARGCVLKAGEEVKLRPKVYETLKYFVEHSGRLIGKDELMRAVWPDAFVTEDSLVQCTVELRRALDDQEQQLLKTVPRRGYLFTAKVVRVQPRPEQLPTIDSYLAAEGSRIPPSGIRRKRR